MSGRISKQELSALAKQISDAFGEVEARKAVALDPLAVLDVLQPLLPHAITPEFRERARLFGALQEEEDGPFRPQTKAKPQPQLQALEPEPEPEPEPFDCSTQISPMAQSAVADLLKAQCGTRRRKRLPEGPTRQRSAQEGGHV